MADEAKVRLRDRREPGHFWIDNEILDVFGDDLGQNGISVYGAMARYCYGTDVRLSLREIAAAARMSKDTVARSMRKLVSLGLLIETKGTHAKTASSWALVSVKALVQEIRVRSAQSVSQGDRLVTGTDGHIASSCREMTLVGLMREQKQNCLMVRQIANGHEVVKKADESAEKSVDKKNSLSQDETDLSQTGVDFETDLSQNGGPYPYCNTQDTKLQDKNKNPQPPSKSKGASVPSQPDAEATSRNANGARVDERPKTWDEGRRELLEAAAKVLRRELLEAAAKVLRECGISDPRMEKVVLRTIVQVQTKCDAAPGSNAIAERMIARHQRFVLDADLMRYRPGVRKFFSHGLWDLPQLWPYDEKKLNQIRRL